MPHCILNEARSHSTGRWGAEVYHRTSFMSVKPEVSELISETDPGEVGVTR
jgi:hypothetical protein